jgi:hypothetical protein
LFEKADYDYEADIMVARGKVSNNDGIETLIVGRDFEEEFQVYPDRIAKDDAIKSESTFCSSLGIFFEMNMELDGSPLLLPRESEIFYSKKLLSFIVVASLPGKSEKDVVTIFRGKVTQVAGDTIYFKKVPLKELPLKNFGT